jgi:hypothetical protein
VFTRRKGLGQLLSLLGITNAESVKVSRASDLEFGGSLSLLNLYGSCILSASLLEEVSDVVDLLRLEVGREATNSKCTDSHAEQVVFPIHLPKTNTSHTPYTPAHPEIH